MKQKNDFVQEDARQAIETALAKFRLLSLNPDQQQCNDFDNCGPVYNFSKGALIVLGEIEESMQNVLEYFYSQTLNSDDRPF